MIETERLILRRWRESDRGPFAEMNADPRVMEFLPMPLTREQSDDFMDRIEAQFMEYGFGLLAAEMRESGEFIGYVGLFVPKFEAWFTPCVEIGWRLAARWWGQGLATEAAQAVMRYGFETVGLKELLSFTAVGNRRSIRVMEKLGMEKIGEFEHPRVAEGSWLRKHVVYRKEIAPHQTRRPIFHMP